MSNTVGYSLGCVTAVRYSFTQGEDATGNGVAFSLSGCTPGCWNGDYRERRYWAQLPASATALSGTDYYGALAPDIKFQGGGTYREICPTVCYCEGPVAEGETVTEYLGRYETRWMAHLLEGGLIYYGRVDGTLIQVPLDLFPTALPDTATHIALSFDANARPVFAYEDEGTIYLVRYVAGVPTTYSWSGMSPCLFFNGVLNYEDTETDVVCYYLPTMGGSLYARFQRENFGVENLVLDDVELTDVKAVDRGRGVLAASLVIEASNKRVFSALYPLWPLFASDRVRVSSEISQIDYARVIVPLGDYEDVVTTTAAILGIEYWSLLVPFSAPAESLAVSASLNAIGYPLVVMEMGSYSESVTVSAAISSIAYPEVSVNAGTYSETMGVSASINSIAYVSA